MKFCEDGMQVNVKCVVNKTSKLKKKSNLLEVHDCLIKGSVTAGTMVIEIPDKNMSVSVATQDILKVLNATNKKYRDLRENELGSTFVQK